MLTVSFSGQRSVCKVCQGPAVLYGVVDFNKSCLELGKVFLPLRGVPVYYHRCESCGLIFSNAFDAWTPADYREHIYNADYITVDPEYADARPRSMAETVFKFLKPAGDIQILDYGSGSGLMAQVLRDKGLSATSWDPMTSQAQPDASHFDVVTSFEVLEHTATPIATAQDMVKRLTPTGVLLFSTLVVDALPPHHVGFWYIAPRNGHVTIYTKKSLQTLFGSLGCRVHHFNETMHMAFQTLPPWLAAKKQADPSAT
jgi:2-polyprenyl-3-methyl-5-hydroxy-6-metoxy-1,4-benzoquinol methylase